MIWEIGGNCTIVAIPASTTSKATMHAVCADSQARTTNTSTSLHHDGTFISARNNCGYMYNSSAADAFDWSTNGFLSRATVRLIGHNQLLFYSREVRPSSMQPGTSLIHGMLLLAVDVLSGEVLWQKATGARGASPTLFLNSTFTLHPNLQPSSLPPINDICIHTGRSLCNSTSVTQNLNM